ncbi:antigen identified by monoclonal antibody Ki-67 [Basidiobolus ranarum]|uniref:Antigen identified by monoclonal antibody Ki-67 n=1 Tax=Basidiobolus ranarum TaxID=34480 RepID=A0ABR2WT10_9FUNG
MGYYGSFIVTRRVGGDFKTFPINKKEFLIGKQLSCDVRIYLPQISDVQCKISFEKEGQATLVNFSENGTMINGQSIGKQDRRALKDKDTIAIHDRTFRFEYTLSNESKPRATPHPPKLTRPIAKPKVTSKVPSSKSSSTRPFETSTGASLAGSLKKGAKPVIGSRNQKVGSKDRDTQAAKKIKVAHESGEEKQCEVKHHIEVKQAQEANETCEVKLQDISNIPDTTSNVPSEAQSPSKHFQSEENVSSIVKQKLELSSSEDSSHSTEHGTNAQNLTSHIAEVESVGSGLHSSSTNSVTEATSPKLPKSLFLPNASSPKKRKSIETTPVVQPSTPSRRSSRRRSSLLDHTNLLGNFTSTNLLDEVASDPSDTKEKEASRRKVTFGPNLSPEIFDKALPPNSPLKRGRKTPTGTPALSQSRLRDVFGSSLGSTSVASIRRVRFGPDLSPEIFDKALPPNSPLKKGRQAASGQNTPRKGFSASKPATPSSSLLKNVLKHFRAKESSPITLDTNEETNDSLQLASTLLNVVTSSEESIANLSNSLNTLDTTSNMDSGRSQVGPHSKQISHTSNGSLSSDTKPDIAHAADVRDQSTNGGCSNIITSSESANTSDSNSTTTNVDLAHENMSSLPQSGKKATSTAKHPLSSTIVFESTTPTRRKSLDLTSRSVESICQVEAMGDLLATPSPLTNNRKSLSSDYIEETLTTVQSMNDSEELAIDLGTLEKNDPKQLDLKSMVEDEAIANILSEPHLSTPVQSDNEDDLPESPLASRSTRTPIRGMTPSSYSTALSEYLSSPSKSKTSPKPNTSELVNEKSTDMGLNNATTSPTKSNDVDPIYEASILEQEEQPKGQVGDNESPDGNAISDNSAEGLHGDLVDSDRENNSSNDDRAKPEVNHEAKVNEDIDSTMIPIDIERTPKRRESRLEESGDTNSQSPEEEPYTTTKRMTRSASKSISKTIQVETRVTRSSIRATRSKKEKPELDDESLATSRPTRSSTRATTAAKITETALEAISEEIDTPIRPRSTRQSIKQELKPVIENVDIDTAITDPSEQPKPRTRRTKRTIDESNEVISETHIDEKVKTRSKKDKGDEGEDAVRALQSTTRASKKVRKPIMKNTHDIIEKESTLEKSEDMIEPSSKIASRRTRTQATSGKEPVLNAAKSRKTLETRGGRLVGVIKDIPRTEQLEPVDLAQVEFEPRELRSKRPTTIEAVSQAGQSEKNAAEEDRIITRGASRVSHVAKSKSDETKSSKTRSTRAPKHSSNDKISPVQADVKDDQVKDMDAEEKSTKRSLRRAKVIEDTSLQSSRMSKRNNSKKSISTGKNVSSLRQKVQLPETSQLDVSNPVEKKVTRAKVVNSVEYGKKQEENISPKHTRSTKTTNKRKATIEPEEESIPPVTRKRTKASEVSKPTSRSKNTTSSKVPARQTRLRNRKN